MSHDLFTFGIPLTEKVLRTIAVYLFLLVGLRLAGKRELGQLNPFDLVVLLLLSNTLQNAIIGNDNSLSGGVVGATTLLALNWLVVRYLYTHPVVARWFEGDADVLVKDGEVQVHRLERELITPAELEAAARRQGLDGLEHVESCRLEIGGALTFVPKLPNDEEIRHRALMERLEAVLETQGALSRRIDELAARAPSRPAQ
ncbi:MAG TPA: YetF domain-containing protein [Gemmatimonadaceae bacterium]|nr:YetF domain-containing protein [Gemmatimonadaceae bacterium]